ncbi:MAG: triphosphoribosyl-dephospho-CoA synthase CitG [Bacilli bacterium]
MNTSKEQISKLLDKLAIQALFDEVETTPKPGLVDLWDSGSHKDMDINTFYNSIEALKGYFFNISMISFNNANPSSLFSQIRPIGIEAEQKMFTATNNVNTHKGLIFSLGVLVSASSYYYSKHHRFEIEEILDFVKEMTQNDLQHDFEMMSTTEPFTHGEKLYSLYKNRGIRGEVADGFPSIRGLYNVEEYEKNKNEINIDILFHLMSTVNDTNILIRTDQETLDYVHKQALICDYKNCQEVEKLNKDFISKNISPGGCADLLAVTIFLILLKGVNDE